MEDSHSKKPLTDSDMEDKCGNKKPYLLPSSSSKPPLGPVPLLLKKPNNNNNSDPSLFPAIEAVSANNSEQDKNQTPAIDESSAHKNNNVALNDASSHHETSNLETKNQHEPTQVSDPSEDARKLKRVLSNRMSAHRSRLRKLEHVANLERQCVQLKNQITVLKPQFEAFGNLKHMLMLEQTVLTQRVEALENERLVKQAEIERNQEEVYMLREIEKRQKEEEAHQAMMSFANWDVTLPNNNHQILVDTNFPAHGSGNIQGTSGMEVDEQTMNMDSFTSMNELDAMVNRPKLSDDDASSEFRFYF
ncbi:hypothetical protein K1719_028127 [Acacia pycnantha]|nr:hypothetical protein K1719_028127 [Acacia pycnantha]